MYEIPSYLVPVFIVGIVGSVVSFLKSNETGVRALGRRILEGAFTAYVIYEIAFFYFHDIRYSLGICGIGAWLGAEGLVLIKDAMVEILKSFKKKDRRYDYDEYDDRNRND